MTKHELIQQLYAQGTSRGMCPVWFATMIQKIREAS